MALLYFAYGSNLKSERLFDRVPGSRLLVPARVADHTLRCDKRGADGSGKANLHPLPGEWVWGVLYALPDDGFERLDRFEGGYERVEIQISCDAPGLERATTYRSLRLTADPTPFDWYRQLILDGAREHGLPESWVARLEMLPARPSS
ncbi:MAG: gamma-glutamylcyclotransferase family protein [Myxococcota bacterium]|nr:gamma-glutamylcyclotransferase family protein [Myxococcota bacterium]